MSGWDLVVAPRDSYFQSREKSKCFRKEKILLFLVSREIVNKSKCVKGNEREIEMDRDKSPGR